MKRMIIANINKRKGFRLNYDAVDRVLDLVEESAGELCDAHTGLNLDVSDTYNSPSEQFIVSCSVDSNSTVLTSKGRTVAVNITRGYYVDVTLQDPPSLSSDYGEVVIDNKLMSGLSPVILSLRVSNSNYSDAIITVNGSDDGKEISIDEIQGLLDAGLSRFLQRLDSCIDEEYNDLVERRRRDDEAQRAKAARRADNKLSVPVTRKNFSQVVTALRKESDSRYSATADYLREVSYENDFTAYYSINDIISGLSRDDVTLGDALADPSVILDYGELESIGIHHASDVPEYDNSKRELNQKYGFSR